MTNHADMQLEIYSLEEDGDDQDVRSLCGLDEETAIFFVKFCNLFTRSKHGEFKHPDEQIFKLLRAAVTKLMREHPTAKIFGSSSDFEFSEIYAVGSDYELDELIFELTCDLLGDARTGFFRVFEKYRAKLDNQEIKLLGEVHD